jgi:hypothetical protein
VRRRIKADTPHRKVRQAPQGGTARGPAGAAARQDTGISQIKRNSGCAADTMRHAWADLSVLRSNG